MSRDHEPFNGGGRAMLAALGCALAGAIGLAVGFAVEPAVAFSAYLVAWSFALSIALGLLAFVMACHAMNAGWPTAIRRLAEAGFAALPLLALLFVPVLAGLRTLYPWMRPDTVADPHTRALLLHKQPYLNLPFFLARAVAFFALWMAIAALLRRWSLRSDGGHDTQARARVLSAALLPMLGLTWTFAAFDWLMALSPDWSSTVFGLYCASGGFVAALGLLPILVLAAQRAGRLTRLSGSHTYALGRLLFAFVAFWAYLAFFQLLIIWLGDKPVEARWYLERLQGGWRLASAFLVLGHFALPFLALLPYAVRRSRIGVALLGGWILFAHWVDLLWIAGPARGPGRSTSWIDAAALLAVGGLVVAFGLRRQRGRLLAPIRDPAFEAALAYESR